VNPTEISFDFGGYNPFYPVMYGFVLFVIGLVLRFSKLKEIGKILMFVGFALAVLGAFGFAPRPLYYPLNDWKGIPFNQFGPGR